MARPVRINIDTTKYKSPTQDDLQAAKDYILQREEFAIALGKRVDDVLEDAAEKIVTICYKHNIKPKELLFSSAFNQDLMDEVADVMDEAEAEILDLIYEYSTRCTDDKERISQLALWMATLGKGDNNLRDTLDTYLYKTMKDWEAAIAALTYMGVKQADAITRIKTYLHHIYEMPEVLTAFRRKSEFAATYIQYGGVQKGAVGISNNGSTNVVNMARHTVQIVWMKNQYLQAKADGAIGYWQGRGSTFLCDICDDEVGFHPNIEEMNTKPFPHYGCCCWRMPIYSIEPINAEKDNSQDNDGVYKEEYSEGGHVRVHEKHGKYEKKENLNIATYLAKKYGYDIDLLPRKEGEKTPDSYNRTLNKNQEYKVNSTPTKGSIDNLIRSAKKQSDSIVLRIDSDISWGDLKDAISDRVKRSGNITDITLIRDLKDVTYYRDEIISKDFKIQWEDFK